jgi:hypothetical protein
VDILAVIGHAFLRVMETWTGLYLILLQLLQDGLRVPLRRAGLEGWPQLLIIALVPLLSLITVIKFLRGFVRIIGAWVFGSFLLYVLWSLISALRAL